MCSCSIATCLLEACHPTRKPICPCVWPVLGVTETTGFECCTLDMRVIIIARMYKASHFLAHERELKLIRSDQGGSDKITCD